MKVVVHGFVALMVALATFYFVYWMGAGSLDLPEWLSIAGSAAVALLMAVYVWTQLRSPSESLMRFIGVGAVAIGGISFLAGFFGPLIFMPEANQGPLLGLFYTGPLGFLLGAVCGGIYGLVRRRQNPAVSR
jgi:hypothetical protein